MNRGRRKRMLLKVMKMTAMLAKRRKIQDRKVPTNGETPLDLSRPTVSESSTGFEDLPNEMKLEIFKYLKLPQKTSARLVCRSWTNVINNTVDFKVGLSDSTFEAVKKFEGDRPIDTLIVQDFSQKISPYSTASRSGYAKNMKHLRFISSEGRAIREFYASLYGNWVMKMDDDVWDAGNGTPQESILNLIRLNPCIETLSFAAKSLELVKNPKLFTKLNLPGLKSLEVSFGDDLDDQLIDDDTSILPYLEVYQNIFPSLQTFKYSCKARYKPLGLLVKTYEFITRHVTTLKSLHVESYETYIYPTPELSLAVASEEKYKNLMQQMCQLKLDELYFRVLAFVPDTSLRWKSLEQTFLSSQTNLKKLELQWIEEMYPTLNFLPSCRSTLRELRIVSNLLEGDFYLAWDAQEKFDCSLLSEFSQLEKLGLDFSEWDFFNENHRARVVHMEKLPQSIKSLSIGGYLRLEEAALLGDRLPNLQEISCHAGSDHEDVIDLMRLLFSFRSLNTIRIHPDCGIIDQLYVGFHIYEGNETAGIHLYKESGGYCIKLDRSKLTDEAISDFEF